MKLITGILGLLYKLYVALVFSFTLLLFYLPIVILKSKSATRKKTFAWFNIWSWCFRILSFIHVRFEKKATLPKAPYIIVSNHASYMDIFVMHSIMPQQPFLFLGKSEILRYPLMKSFFKNLHIPVHRKDRLKAAKSFIAAKEALANGWSLVIFPEGTIPDNDIPRMLPFKDGAFKLAMAAKVPLIPLTFMNNHRLFSDPGVILGEAHPGISRVIRHEAILPEDYANLSVNELSDKVFRIISEPLYSELNIQ